MKRSVLVVFIVCVGLVSAVSAAPVQNPNNGHWYEIVQTPSTWTAANAAATSMTHLAQSGYLATITSALEQNWIWSTFSAEATQHLWIGARQNPADTDPPTQGQSANWGWENGEPWAYTAWYPGEPNDYQNRPEDKAYMLYNDNGLWNDNIDNTIIWFLVEYDGSSIPTENSTWGAIKAIFEQ